MLDYEKFCQDGVLKIDAFVYGQHLIDLQAEFDKAIVSCATNYPPGAAARIGREQFGLMPKTVSTFKQPMFSDFVRMYLGEPLEFMLQIFLTYENKVLPKEQWARNQHPHFDPYHALKFLLFLTDVSKETGAFACVPGSVETGKMLRGRNPLQKNLQTHAYTLEHHPDFAHLADDLVYMEGEAGMLLVIDTDMIHGGGILLREGSERKVINVHNRRR